MIRTPCAAIGVMAPAGMAVCAIVLGVVALAPTASAEPENARFDLVALEQRALDRASAMHLRRLMTAVPEAAVGAAPTRAWLARQPAADGGREWQCLSEALYFEARGETVEGQFAVAEVILNRVESPRFPDSVCGVVEQGTGARHACQFSYNCDGRPEHIAEPIAWAHVGKVARAVLDDGPRELTDGATHYHTIAVNPGWAHVYEHTAQIGVHRFYRHDWQASRR